MRQPRRPRRCSSRPAGKNAAAENEKATEKATIAGKYHAKRVLLFGASLASGKDFARLESEINATMH